jgi:monoamine oxidase
MRETSTRFAILGGGLAGVYAAFLLEQRGITDYVLLEARSSPGGRIQSMSSVAAQASRKPAAIDRFDLGPTWFWPALQPELDQLVEALGLQRFPQHETGDMMLERSPHQPPARTFGYVNSPPSMRLVGGMAALVEALQRHLRAESIFLGQTVFSAHVQDGHVHIRCGDPSGEASTVQAQQVLLALPPRLAQATIDFSPPLPAPIAHQWRQTATWMAPHAKYVAVYEAPFWRQVALSGEARSACGPLGEIHDASMPGGSAALFGFFAVPVAARRGVSEQVLIRHCRSQLVRLFGPQASHPTAEFLKDWALDDLTATTADQDPAGGHPSPPPATIPEGQWRDRLVGVGSEWSPQFPGYIAGAIEAARLGVDALLAPQTASSH